MSAEISKTPLQLLDRWLIEADATGVPAARSATFVTANQDARPSARTMLLKRLEDEALVFTSALWTRKARDIESNPHVALLFHWPALKRQAHIAGQAIIAPRELAVELFFEREYSHSVQTLVSRQGEVIEDIEPLRTRFADLMQTHQELKCPPDWGAIRVVPDAIEFWQEAPDRMHDRLLYERSDESWNLSRLSP